MAQKALLISVNDLKKKSIISGMTDADKILQYIEVAQDTYIHQFLGTDLYNKIQADIIADTLTGVYLTLVNNYIKDMLIWYSQATYLPFAAVTIGNGGIYKKVPENAEVISSSEQDKLIAKIMFTADFYTDRFLAYMCNNSTSFPEYTSNSDGDIHPDKDSTYSNWVL